MLHWFGKRLREMEEVRREERGFTLIELLVVVIIIGILAAIAIPVFLNQRDKAEKSKVKSDVRNVVSVYQLNYAESGSYPAAVSASSATIGSGDAKHTPSQNVKITTTVNGSNFTVCGASTQLTSWAYKYDSSTGAYTEPASC